MYRYHYFGLGIKPTSLYYTKDYTDKLEAGVGRKTPDNKKVCPLTHSLTHSLTSHTHSLTTYSLTHSHTHHSHTHTYSCSVTTITPYHSYVIAFTHIHSC